MLDWSKYIAVADKYQHKAKRQDRDDLNHDIIVSLAEAQLRLDQNGGGQLSDVAMLRIASYTVARYWRLQYKFTNGIDCASCSKAQRLKCRAENLYSDCPKAIKIEYLSKPLIDDDGNITELAQTIADDKAIDLEAWLDRSLWQLGFPKRLVEIAHKIAYGAPLDAKDKMYLCRFRQKEQKRLF